jgi:chemotaxis protein histidine kinase CheA
MPWSTLRGTVSAFDDAKGLGIAPRRITVSTVGLPDKIRELNDAWEQLNKTAWDPAAFQTMIRLVHRLAGSGGSYGFVTISEAARRLELYAKSLDGTVRPAP